MPDPQRPEHPPSIGKGMTDAMRTLGGLGTAGFAFVIAIVLGAWFGWLLDGWLGTGPWLFLLFFFLGVIAGVINVYRISSRFWK
jgi:ATP synthase protein I